MAHARLDEEVASRAVITVPHIIDPVYKLASAWFRPQLFVCKRSMEQGGMRNPMLICQDQETYGVEPVLRSYRLFKHCLGRDILDAGYDSQTAA